MIAHIRPGGFGRVPDQRLDIPFSFIFDAILAIKRQILLGRVFEFLTGEKLRVFSIVTLLIRCGQFFNLFWFCEKKRREQDLLKKPLFVQKRLLPRWPTKNF